MNLIRTSARNASAQLQFARIAFGAAGSAGMPIDTGDAEAVATAFLEGEKPSLPWNGRRALMPKNKVKLLLNLILVANAAIPRGGKIAVTLDGTEDRRRNSPFARPGRCARAAEVSRDAFRATCRMTDRRSSVQPYYTLPWRALAAWR